MNLDLMFYRQWYDDDVKDALSADEKKLVLKQISDISLRQPIHLPGVEIGKDEVPLLRGLTRLEKFTGRQLMVAMFAIAEELGLPVPNIVAVG
jgi:hypothetical protein